MSFTSNLICFILPFDRVIRPFAFAFVFILELEREALRLLDDPDPFRCGVVQLSFALDRSFHRSRP
jgi:hypothetical protein